MSNQFATLPNHSFREAIDKIAGEVGVPPDVLEAMIWVESNFKPDARSASSAIGLTQVIYRWHSKLVDSVAKELGRSPGPGALLDPTVNLTVGARFLKSCYGECGTWPSAVRKYHSGRCNPPEDFVDGQGTSSEMHIQKFLAALRTVRAARESKEPAMAVQYGNVPIYGYFDRFISSKREGFGWNNLGKRNIRFVTLHRMVGTLRGTDSYFRNPNISSYTDFGIATSTSDPGIPGVIYLWNYPTGLRSPWASGPVSAPFGDGRAIVNKYGINAVNRDGISLEIGGTNEAIDQFTWNEIVHFIAYWADQSKVPYTTFPLNPATGISFVLWHTEFTAGTGKKCPFQWLMDRTPQLIKDVQAFMKRYQETTVVVKPTPTTPVPSLPSFTNTKGAQVRAKVKTVAHQAPDKDSKIVMQIPAGLVGSVEFAGVKTADGLQFFDFRGPGGTGFVRVDQFEAYTQPKPVDPPKEWMDPAPVPELAMSDPDSAKDFKISNGTNFRPVFDTVRAKRQGKQRRFAIDGDKVNVIGPDYKPGQEFTAMYRFTNDTGTEYYYLSNHARVLFDDFDRIKD